MKKILVFLLCLSLVSIHADALEIARIFNEHGVLQRDINIPLWGWANTGEQICLSFLGKDYFTKANIDGKWEIVIPPTPYGGPYVLKVVGESNTIVLNDIYVGDIWVCSGQSNMDFQLSGCFDGKLEVSNADDPLIRHFRVPQSFAEYPSDKLAGGTWYVCNPENAASFSAVAYFFAKNVREEFPDLPIGLINNAWGGSRIEPFLSASSFMQSQDEINRQINHKVQETRDKTFSLMKYLDDIPEVDQGMVEGKAIYSENNYNDAAWDKMKLPVAWEEAGLPSLDGIVWFRKKFNINKLDEADSITLAIGRIDDDAQIWINGYRIDNLFNRSYQWSDLRIYKLKSTLFNEGENVITTRVDDTGGGGGMGGQEGEMYVATGTEKIDISGEWKFKIGKVYLNFLYGPRQQPTTIYNKMVHPIINFKTKGFLWYQGESNTDDVKTAQNYEQQFKTLIKQWRNDWGDPSLPFYYVQLASFLEEVKKPTDHTWAHLRWSQYKALDIPETGMASAIDIGDANDIHPRNKKEVGRRLALIALNKTYGKSDLQYLNPHYKTYEVRNSKIIVRFDNYGEDLIVDNKYGYVNGFALAGVDGEFKWARAILKENSVEIWHPEIVKPVSLRYAWEANVLDANLFSKDRLPVVPFKIEFSQPE